MAFFGLVLAGPVFHLHGTTLEVAKFAFVVSGIGFAGQVTRLAMGGSLPMALQRYDIVNVLRVASAAIFAIGAATIVWTGHGLRPLVVWNASVDFLLLIVTIAVARRLFRSISFRPALDRARISKLLTFSLWVFVGNLSAFILYQFDRVLLGSLDSVSSVTYYAVAGSAASYVYAIVGSLASVVIPASTELFARGDRERARRLYERATRFCVLVVGSIAIPIVVFANPIVRIWLGASYAHKTEHLLQILVVTFALLSLSIIPFNILIGAGRPRTVGLLNVAIAFLNVTFVLVLVPSYGATGAAVAYLVSVLVFPFFIRFAERDALGYPHVAWGRITWRVFRGCLCSARSVSASGSPSRTASPSSCWRCSSCRCRRRVSGDRADRGGRAARRAVAATPLIYQTLCSPRATSGTVCSSRRSRSRATRSSRTGSRA